MASSIIFILSTIVASILLLVAGISSALGASNIASVTFTDQTASAHRYLTIGAVFGITSFVVLLVVLLIFIFTRKSSSTEENYIKSNLSELQSHTEIPSDISKITGTQIVLLIILGGIALLAIAVGVLGILAAINLANNNTPALQSAYVEAIITALAGVGGMGILIIAITTYILSKNRKTKTGKNKTEIEMKQL